MPDYILSAEQVGASIQLDWVEDSFATQSTRFNGTSSRLNNASLSYVGSDEGTVAFWLYENDSWAQLKTIFNARLSGGGISMEVKTYSAGRIAFNLTGASDFITATDTFTTGQWHHVIWSYKAGSGGWNKISIDGSGSLIDATSLTSATLSIDDTQTYMLVATEDTGSGFFKGDLAYIYINLSTALDLSVQANREKFILAGAPVNLGADGSTPTGSQPHFYLDGGASMVNLGTAGSLTATDLAAGGTPALP